MIPQPGSYLAEQVIQESVESARREFLSTVESRIDGCFAKATQIVRYLETEAIDVLCPLHGMESKG